MMHLGNIFRIQATARRRDPNDGVTVVWVLGLETHPRLEPLYFISAHSLQHGHDNTATSPHQATPAPVPVLVTVATPHHTTPHQATSTKQQQGMRARDQRVSSP